MLKDSTNSPLVFRSGGKLSLASATTTNAAGQPTARFRKDLIRVGEYTKASTGQDFKITPADLDAFAKTFAGMKTAGVKVPLPVGHTNDPEKNRGYAEDIFVDGDVLVGTLELVGEDAIKLAGRSEVSVCIEPELIDGKGNKHLNAIEHIAIVTDPVVPEQGGWIKIAASRSTDAPRQAAAVTLSTGAPTMKLAEIAAMLGLTVAATADDAALGAEIKTKLEAMKAAGGIQAAEITTLKASLSRNAGVPDVDEDALDMAATAVATRIDALEAQSKIHPKTALSLKAILCGNAADRQSKRVLLSRKASKAVGIDSCIASAIVDAIDQCVPKELGEKAMAQAMTLSRANPGDEKKMTAAEEDKATTDRAAAINASRGFKTA